MITLENVSKSYAKGQPALNDVSLHIDKGEFVFIVGNSGSGKSTLIKLLLKELEPTSGTIIVNDQNLGKMKRRKVPKYRRGVGVVFQDFRLLKDRNVYENVAFAQRVIERPNRVIKKRVPEILTLVGLAEKYKSFPRELSGGEQQRVALARALVNRPNILLADEPTGNLDPKNSLEIMKLLEEINERGTTVLVVTHNREIVNSFRKRVITMRKGVIVSDEEEGGYLEDSTIGYSAKQGIKNIWRNIMFSAASIATMTACIFLFGLFFSLLINFRYIVKNAEEGVAVTVLFDDGVDQATINSIGEQIKAYKGVTKVEYVSAEEAWDEWSKQYFGDTELASEMAEGFKNDNPLANSSSYSVYVDKIEHQDALVKYIEGLDGVREVNQLKGATQTLSSFNTLLTYISVAIILILLCVAVFLISNTVAIGISIRKEEIGIMKLIGATNFFVRAPFLIEGMIIGLIGAIIPLVLLFVMYKKVIEYVLTKFSMLSSVVQFMSVTQVFEVLTPVALILGMGIGLFGSVITIRKHLRV